MRSFDNNHVRGELTSEFIPGSNRCQQTNRAFRGAGLQDDKFIFNPDPHPIRSPASPGSTITVLNDESLTCPGAKPFIFDTNFRSQ